MTQKTTTIIHISDLHFGIDSVCFSDLLETKSLFSKRMIGWSNKRLRKARKIVPLLRKRLLEHLNRAEWDYLIITGDLTTLALKKEFMEARTALDPLIERGTVLLTPGNHDRYVPHEIRQDQMKSYFLDCFPFHKEYDGTKAFHVSELSNSLTLFEIDMASPRSLISSKGSVKLELDQLQQQIKSSHPNTTKIAIGHYPVFLPPGIKEGYFHSVENKKALQQFFYDSDISLYLHGHIHKSWMISGGAHGKYLSINSAGSCFHETGEWSGYHKITFQNGTFSISREEIPE